MSLTQKHVDLFRQDLVGDSWMAANHIGHVLRLGGGGNGYSMGGITADTEA